MDDTTRAALDAETPINPYSLVAALNTAAARTSVHWLLFLGLMGYIALGVGTLTHRDLILDAGITLPLLQTRIDVARFFIGAAAVLALAHLALITQLVPVARKAVEFHNAVRLLESTELRSHPLRLEVDSFFFVQAIAGPERSRVVGAVLHGLGWLTVLVLPLALLVYLQIALLPFHNAAVTLAQRAIVLADVAVVLLVGVFLRRAETSFPGALLRLSYKNPLGAVLSLGTLAAAASVALIATVPGAGGSAPLLGLFPRSLELADASLLSDKDRLTTAIGGRSINLRGRDLRYARLDRADLRQADLTGANLDGASLVGADLRGARLGCAKPAGPQQGDGRADAGCTSARGADFSAAQMAGAVLAGADLAGARFDEASLERADLTRAQLTGASFDRARLQRATFTSAVLYGASLVQASLQGATLAGARLEMADLKGAGLQGASLAGAHLAGAALRQADLEGAQLQGARLLATDLTGARLKAADLAGAMVWRALPPAADATALAGVAGAAITPPAAADVDALKDVVARTESDPATADRAASLKGLIAGIGDARWEGSADGQAWAALVKASDDTAEGFKTRLAEHLGRLACRTRFAEAVATAVVTRALDAGFKGDVAVLHDRLKAVDCAGAHTIPRAAMLDLAAAAEAAKATAGAQAAASGSAQGQ